MAERLRTQGHYSVGADQRLNPALGRSVLLMSFSKSNEPYLSVCRSYAATISPHSSYRSQSETNAEFRQQVLALG